ncbi:MAG TPA: type II toxin-antitoxin system VapC family toxin [Bryobacteraceae bacterium]|nr:type II toxin-antitoxin system VapC family toxin [Bryobacteraceae bacterium]
MVDTSTLIWVLADSKRLSAKARKALQAGPLVLSVVSFWEIVLKAQKGSLDIADPVHWWSRATDLSGGVILSIRPAHISVLAGLPPIHKDPFDRLLVAQAVSEGLVIVTSDEKVCDYPVKTLW